MQLLHFEVAFGDLISCLNDLKLKWSTSLYLIIIGALTVSFCPFRFAEGAAISITLNLANSITITQKIPLASSEISFSIAVSSEKPWTSASSKDIGRKPCWKDYTANCGHSKSAFSETRPNSRKEGRRILDYDHYCDQRVDQRYFGCVFERYDSAGNSFSYKETHRWGEGGTAYSRDQANNDQKQAWIWVRWTVWCVVSDNRFTSYCYVILLVL